MGLFERSLSTTLIVEDVGENSEQKQNEIERKQNEIENKQHGMTAKKEKRAQSAQEGRPDTELVAETQKGDRRAYRELVEKYQSRVFSIAYEILRSREDAEDVAQEAFVKAFLSLKGFQGKSAFYTWLYRITYNMAIDHRRRLARRGGVSLEFDETYLNSSDSQASYSVGKSENPQEAVLRKEQGQQLEAAIADLSEEHRAVITLREIDGLSYDEIAKVTGVSKGTIMSRLHYARKRLQEVVRTRERLVAAESDPEALAADDLEQGKKAIEGGSAERFG